MVTTAGDRLDRLYALRRQLNSEISLEEARRGINRVPSQPLRPSPTPAPRPVPESTSDRLAAAGVTTRQVKEWAHRQGLIDHLPRGRLNPTLLEDFLHAHPTEPTTSKETPA